MESRKTGVPRIRNAAVDLVFGRVDSSFALVSRLAAAHVPALPGGFSGDRSRGAALRRPARATARRPAALHHERFCRARGKTRALYHRSGTADVFTGETPLAWRDVGCGALELGPALLPGSRLSRWLPRRPDRKNGRARRVAQIQEAG